MDGVEIVLEQGVLDGLLTVRLDDVKVLQRDDLGRGDAVCSPIPVRRSKVLRCMYPPVFILVLFGDVKGMLLK